MAFQEEMEVQGNFLFKHRGELPVIFLLISLWVWYQTLITRQGFIGTPYEEGYMFLCLAVSMLGILFRIMTTGYSATNTSGRNTAGQLADTVNTLGTYSTVRHPLYVGNFLVWTGIIMLTQNLWFIATFIVLYAFYYERIMFAEEQFLRRKFGETYLKWAEKTPMFFPALSQWQRPAGSFDAGKVARMEKTGIMSTFLIFFIFDAIRQYVHGHSFDPTRFWFLAFAVSLTAHLIIKMHTKWKRRNERRARA
ncbi:MAG: DUF1295 domain-containing protein [Calditrichaeota bacterium]|nr:MAG: DUF1295 domain-containing protein [Calditrichota bacterium]